MYIATLLHVALPLIASLEQPVTSIVRGSVVELISRRPVVGASVSLNGASTVLVRTDSSGRFIAGRVARGVYLLQVSALGKDPVKAELRVSTTSANDTIELELELADVVVHLNRVEVVDSLADPRLQEFFARKQVGLGRFFGPSFWAERQGTRPSAALPARVPGLSIRRVRGKDVIVSQRQGRLCVLRTVVNGIAMPWLEIDRYDARDILGIEVYAQGSVPSEHNVTGDDIEGPQCGAILLWIK